MREIDAFSLPPPSTERLRLLFLTVAAGAFFGGYWFLVLARDGWRAQNGACGQLAQVADFLDCSTRILVLQSLAPLAGPALVAVLVVLAYVAAPAMITRWHRAEPYAPWPEAVRATVEEAGLSRPPVLMVSGRGLLPRMFTYGRYPRYRVMLPGSIRLYAVTDPSTVTATLAHELGHLRNRDVDRTYLAMFAAICLALVTVVPMGLSAAMTTGATPAFSVTWRNAVLALLVAATFAAAIRAREHDADLRAGQYRPVEMDALLSGGRQERRGLLRLHPRIARRLEVLRSPALLMRPSVAEAVASGIAAGVIVDELGVILQAVLPVPSLVAYWAAGAVAAFPVSGVVGLGLWRAASARTLTWGATLGSGVALGAGLVIGALLAPRSSVQWNLWLSGAPDYTAVAALDQILPGTAIWMVAVLLLLTTLITGWLALAARAWIPGAGPRAWRYAAPFAALLFAVVMGTWFVAARLAAAERWGPADLAALVITPQVALFLMLLVFLSSLALWPRVRTAPAAAALLPAVPLVLVLPLAPLLVAQAPTPVPVGQAARLPDSTQAGAICLGLYTVGTAAFGAPADHPARARLGELLRDSDDPLLRQVGDMFLRGARARSQDLAAVAWTAFVRRCDHLNRYPGRSVPDPVSPFPVEGW
ncbi:M48 family metalloprotease [Streptosporangium sp. NPDC051023]|uniref:M48 family metalloprotease n=1 Tax=Streptosporangium sp. NPDC051023 TaxID=3155410 RepID=UPI00344CB7F0